MKREKLVGLLWQFWNKGEDINGTIGILVRTIVVCITYTKGLITRVLGEPKVVRLKFKDTTRAKPG